MSLPVVAIGFILLIPSFFGILSSMFVLFAVSFGSTTTTAEDRRQAIATMRQEDIPPYVIQAVLDGDMATVDEWASQSDIPHVSVRIVRGAQSALAARKGVVRSAAAFGGSAALLIAICSFVGGLLGWLLVMRKRVLQCGFCGAVVNAS